MNLELFFRFLCFKCSDILFYFLLLGALLLPLLLQRNLIFLNCNLLKSLYCCGFWCSLGICYKTSENTLPRKFVIKTLFIPRASNLNLKLSDVLCARKLISAAKYQAQLNLQQLIGQKGKFACRYWGQIEEVFLKSLF